MDEQDICRHHSPAFHSAHARRADDDPELIDTEQGVLHLKGMRCALAKPSAAEVADFEARYGITPDMPEAVERIGLRPQADLRDFMYDELRADDVECDAIQLSMHGRTIKQ